MAATTTPRLLTWEEFEQLPDGDGYHRELLDGELQILPPQRVSHIRLANRALHAVLTMEELGPGTAFAEAGFKLHSKPPTWIQPDVSLLGPACVHAVDNDDYFTRAPDLAVEIVSPSESASDLQRKVAMLLDAGSQAVWVIYPKTRTVVVHLPDGTSMRRGLGDRLSATFLIEDGNSPWPNSLKTNFRLAWLVGTAVIAGVFLILYPRTPQPENYHLFADQRTLLGIPNFWNVVSNLPFLIVGLLGLRTSRDTTSRLMFAGVLLTGFGSAYYHLHPNDATLVWDRLPMTLVFMPLLAAVIGKWIDPACERTLLLPLTAFGIASVLWWRATGDLRPYGVVQFGPLLVYLPALWTDRKIRALWPVLAWYALVKVAEEYDRAIYSVFPLSGHTIKHFAAALATYWILRWSSTFSATPPPSSNPQPAAMPTAN